MQIKIKDADSFRCANNARADADFQAVFRFIRLSPQGAVSGTDGFVLAHNPNGCEPFEAEGDIFIRPSKKVFPQNADNIVIDTEAKLIRWTEGRNGKPGVMPFDMLTHKDTQFPDVERVIPRTRGEHAGEPFAVNVKFVERLTKGITANRTVNNAVTFEASGRGTPMFLNAGNAHPDLILMIVPLRGGAEVTRLEREYSFANTAARCIAAIALLDTVQINADAEAVRSNIKKAFAKARQTGMVLANALSSGGLPDGERDLADLGAAADAMQEARNRMGFGEAEASEYVKQAIDRAIAEARDFASHIEAVQAKGAGVEESEAEVAEAA